VDIHGNKICECEAGFSQLEDMCVVSLPIRRTNKSPRQLFPRIGSLMFEADDGNYIH